MSEYEIEVKVPRILARELTLDEKQELLKQMAEPIDEVPRTTGPPRHLSEGGDSLAILGTIILSNPENLSLLYQALKSHARFSVGGISLDGDGVVFEVPSNIDITLSPDITLVGKYEGTSIYEAEEYPEEIKELDRRRFLEKVNEGRPDDEQYRYEEFFEKGEIHPEEKS